MEKNEYVSSIIAHAGTSDDVKSLRRILREMYFESMDAVDDREMQRQFHNVYNDLDEMLSEIQKYRDIRERIECFAIQ